MISRWKIEQAETQGRALVTTVHGRIALVLPVQATPGSDADAQSITDWILRVVRALEAAGIDASN